MKNIGLDLRYWRAGVGGIGRYSQNLLTELLKLESDNQYTAIITDKDEAEFTLKAANLTKLIVPVDYYSYKEQYNLFRIFNRHRFDLMHFSHFSHPILYRRPFVVTVHDLIQWTIPTGGQGKSPIRRWAYSLAIKDCRRAKRIIVPSQSTKKDLIEIFKFPPQKIVVIPEGAQAEFRVHSQREIVNVKERLKLPERYLLFVSRWSRYKGLDLLLKVYEELSSEYRDLGLVICGRAAENEPAIASLITQAQAENPKIVTPGFVSDEELSAIYSAASIYVHPSQYEGFGIMILEAFATGTPVITTNVSSLPEVVGDAGLLVAPNNSGQLKEAIKKVLDDRQFAEQLITKGLERVKKYSWTKMAKDTLAVYQEVLD